MQKFKLYEDVVKSIRDVRPVFPEMKDEQFAEWYSGKFMISVQLVLKIVKELNQYEGAFN